VHRRSVQRGITEHPHEPILVNRKIGLLSSSKSTYEKLGWLLIDSFRVFSNTFPVDFV
jgi:hypothetical protein